MKRILVVDDSRLDRMLIAGLLRGHGDFDISFAENGKDAMQKMVQMPPDLVISDLVMPEIDGLQLVREARCLFPGTPIILMTAYGNEMTAVEALRSGAASYVPKARQAELLQETVDRVLEKASGDENPPRMPGCAKSIHCQYELDNDPALIRPLIAEIREHLVRMDVGNPNERLRTLVALEEAILNAMYHGNLELSEQDHTSSNGQSLSTLFEQRRSLPQYQGRKIRVDVYVSDQSARLLVSDEGRGYDVWSVAAHSKTECFESGRGRGLMLIESLMDKVVHNEVGNEVTLIKRW